MSEARDGSQAPLLLSDDIVLGMHNVCLELFGEDTPAIRKRIYRMRSEIPRDRRLRGWITLNGKVGILRSVVRNYLEKQSA